MTSHPLESFNLMGNYSPPILRSLELTEETTPGVYTAPSYPMGETRPPYSENFQSDGGDMTQPSRVFQFHGRDIPPKAGNS